MLAAYIFSLVLGGGLLSLSLIGDFFDSDADADLDADAGGLEGGSEIAKLLSLRALVYALFGFGASGIVLHLAWDGGRAGLAALVAGGMGIGAGALVSAVFGLLKRGEAGAIEGEAALAGETAEVLAAIAPADTGEVRVAAGARRLRLRARRHDADARDSLEAGRQVVVVEVRDGVAYVAPADLLEP